MGQLAVTRVAGSDGKPHGVPVVDVTAIMHGDQGGPWRDDTAPPPSELMTTAKISREGVSTVPRAQLVL